MDTSPPALKPRLSLRKNFVWMTTGETIDVACRWGLLVVLSKFLHADAVGTFGLSLAIIVPTITFSNMGLRHAQSTDVSHAYSFKEYRILRMLTSSSALIVIALIAWSIDQGNQIWQVIMLIAISRVIEAQSDAYYGLFQNRERMDYVAKARILRGPLALTFFGFGIYFTSDLRIGCLGLIASATIVLLFHNMRHAKGLFHLEDDANGRHRGTFASRLNRERLLALLRLVFPLGCVALLSSLANNVPRYFIGHELGLEALGYFTAVAAPYSAVTRLVSAVAHSASARLARKYQQNARRSFLMLLIKLGGIGFAIGSLGMVAAAALGEEILTILYSPAYAQYKTVFALVMFGAFLRVLSNLWQFGIIAARRFWTQFLLQSIVILVAVIGNAVLVPSFGLTGAAIAVILVAATHFCSVLTINSFLIRKMSILNH